MYICICVMYVYMYMYMYMYVCVYMYVFSGGGRKDFIININNRNITKEVPEMDDRLG